MLQDIAAVTGAEFISDDLGKKLETVELAHLGHAHRVVATKDATTIIGGKGDKKAIEERVAQLKVQIKKTESDFDKEKLQERVGKLAGGVAVIKVGAPTETAQKELKQRVEDAVAATRAAMEEGIVPGGGIALFNVLLITEKNEEKKGTDVERAAVQILRKAMETPLRAIVQNSGESDGVLMQLKSKTDAWHGFNALKNEIGDLKEAGIIDPLKVTKTAFMNAISVAATYLTVGAAITDIPEKKNPSVGGGMPGMGGMGMGEDY